MARNQRPTYLKRQKEQQRKERAERKRDARRARRLAATVTEEPGADPGAPAGLADNPSTKT